MNNESRTIRDFIYVDVDRLYSLYSQVFEGVADQILQSYMDASTTTNTQKESMLKGGSLEAQVAEVSRRTENKFLYDHMYNQFEESIHHALIDSPEVSSRNYRDILRDAFMIKIKGSAEVEDYSQLNKLMEKFNEIGEAIAYAGVISTEISEVIEQLETDLNQIRDRNDRAKAKAKAKPHTDKKKLAQERAKQLGLHHDEQSLKNLKLFSELFNKDAFEITITPSQKSENVVFRGVLDKKWLRISPDLLQSLYGGFIEANWAMVGQVTYIPGVELPEANQGSVSDEIDTNPSMRDPYRSMFRAARVLERMFFESKERVEVIIYPLAVYREMLLPAK
jgi:hypothetical protein